MRPNLQNQAIYLTDVIKNYSRSGTRKFLRKFYEGVINAGAHRGYNSLYTWQFFTEKYNNQFKNAIELGCSMGRGISEARRRGFNVWGIDHAHIPQCWKQLNVDKYCFTAELIDLPFKDNTFDLVMIPDVLEHIPEEDIPQILSEIRRIGSHQYYALIAMVMDKGIDGRCFTHITLKDSQWWEYRFFEAGFLLKAVDHFTQGDRTTKLGFMMEKHQPEGRWHYENKFPPWKI